MNNEDTNPTIEDVNKIVDRLLDKNKNIEQNLAKLENQITDCKDNLAKINDKLVKGNNEIKQVEGYILDRIIQSMGKKPEVRWWHRLGDEIDKTMDKIADKIFKKMMKIKIILSLLAFLAIFYLCYYLDYSNINHKIISYFCVCILAIVFIIPVYVTVTKGYMMLRETSTISNIKILMNDFRPCVRFLSMIFFIQITLFATNELTLKPMIFVYKHPKIMQLFHWMFSNYPKFFMVSLSFAAFLFFLGYLKISTAIIKTTLQSFNDKWRYYETSISTVVLVIYTTVIALIYIQLQAIIDKKAEKEELYTKEYYDVIGNNYIYIFTIIYVLIFLKFVFANYKIDKKLIAIWEQKNKQLEQFTKSISDH